MMTKPALLFALFSLSLCAQVKPGDGEVLAPYYPTPETIVQKMLQLGGLKAGEKMFDLGSGDGRIVIMAADKFHANAVGVELDKDLFKQSMDRIQKLKLQTGSKDTAFSPRYAPLDHKPHKDPSRAPQVPHPKRICSHGLQ